MKQVRLLWIVTLCLLAFNSMFVGCGLVPPPFLAQRDSDKPPSDSIYEQYRAAVRPPRPAQPTAADWLRKPLWFAFACLLIVSLACTPAALFGFTAQSPRSATLAAFTLAVLAAIVGNLLTPGNRRRP